MAERYESNWFYDGFDAVDCDAPQVEDVRREMAGSGKFPTFSGIWIPKSVPPCGFKWFPPNSGVQIWLL